MKSFDTKALRNFSGVNTRWRPLVWRQLLDKTFISSCHKYMPSRPLLISPIHRVNSSSRPVYLKVSSSHLVVSSSHLVVLSSHLVVSSFLTYCLGNESYPSRLLLQFLRSGIVARSRCQVIGASERLNKFLVHMILLFLKLEHIKFFRILPVYEQRTPKNQTGWLLSFH